LVAGLLSTESVAALSATRLLLMPINLMSSGIAVQMLPTSSVWLQHHGSAKLFRRLILIAVGLGALASCYIALMWMLRDAILARAMHKHFAQSDMLIAIWSAVFLVMVFRDQLHFLLGANGLHRLLLGITGISAITSLLVGWLAILRIGAVGAPLGVLVGELLNLMGIVFLSLRHIRHEETSTTKLPTPDPT
jgi:O-antigen/teichoic acid export membrane protein